MPPSKKEILSKLVPSDDVDRVQVNVSILNEVMDAYGLRDNAGTPGLWANIKKDNVIGRALAVIGPPDGIFSYNNTSWAAALECAYCCARAGVNVGSVDDATLKTLKSYIPHLVARFYELSLSSELYESPNSQTRFQFVRVLDIICNPSRISVDKTFVENLVGDKAFGWLLQLWFILPIPDLQPGQPGAFVEAISSLVGYVYGSARLPDLAPDALQFCRGVGVSSIMERVTEVFRLPTLHHPLLFRMSMKIITPNVPTNDLFFNSFLGYRFPNIALAAFYGALKATTDTKEVSTLWRSTMIFLLSLNIPPDITKPESAVVEHGKQTIAVTEDRTVMMFFSGAIFNLAKIEASRELDDWTQATRNYYNARAGRTPGIMPTKSESLAFKKMLGSIWVHTNGCLEDLSPQNKCRSIAIQKWKDFLAMTETTPEELIAQENERNKKLEKGRQPGCGWYKCPLYGVETVQQPLECRGCRKILYCSDFCHEMDWPNHESNCKP